MNHPRELAGTGIYMQWGGVGPPGGREWTYSISGRQCGGFATRADDITISADRSATGRSRPFLYRKMVFTITGRPFRQGGGLVGAGNSEFHFVAMRSPGGHPNGPRVQPGLLDGLSLRASEDKVELGRGKLEREEFQGKRCHSTKKQTKCKREKRGKEHTAEKRIYPPNAA